MFHICVCTCVCRCVMCGSTIVSISLCNKTSSSIANCPTLHAASYCHITSGHVHVCMCACVDVCMCACAHVCMCLFLLALPHKFLFCTDKNAAQTHILKSAHQHKLHNSRFKCQSTSSNLSPLRTHLFGIQTRRSRVSMGQ